MDSQMFIVLTIVAVAALYIGRRLWPTHQTHPGCGSCPHNRNRPDDYVLWLRAFQMIMLRSPRQRRLLTNSFSIRPRHPHALIG